MRALLITNAGAGSHEDDTVREVLTVLRTEAEVDVAETDGPDQLREALADIGDRVVVVAGGDGSLHAVVNSLFDSGRLADTTLALIPLGTGNDFARGQGIPLEPTDAARVVLSGQRRRVDVLVDEHDGVVVNNVHAGASAQASRRGSRWKEPLGRVGVGRVNLGRLGYPVGAAIAAVRPPFVLLSVDVDGDRVVDRRRVLMVSVGNSSHIGGGTEVTPDASPEDGSADVMISLAVGPLARFGYVAQLRMGRHVERDDVLTRRGRRVLVEGEQFYVSADGEIDGPLTRRTWTVEPAAFEMVLPTS